MVREENPFIIDVEASGFGATSYPIEIGIAMGDGDKFCTLIMPAPDWTDWDDQAEKVHCVPRDVLEAYGKPMHEVAEKLNQLLEGKTVYTEGWGVDKPWLTTLFDTAGVEMKFDVASLEMILSAPQKATWHDTRDKVIQELNPTRHRASYDALIIQETFKRTLEYD